MPIIRYVDPDPRAGRIVRLSSELAERAVEAGRAEELTEEEAAKADVPIPQEDETPPAAPRARRGGRRK